jgi:eukaryotic-like serine/threonine-protein kinase
MRSVGRYLAYREIAKGGMASIYLGCLPGPFDFTRRVAIKELHRHLLGQENVLAMFVDEALLASRLVHPNVVPIIDVVHEEDHIFLVMDYIEGESLATALGAATDSGKTVPQEVAAAIVVDTLRGLHAAHELRDGSGDLLALVHRDVSPQNVLIGTDGTTRLVDFGIAKARERMFSTQGAELKGKVPYMSPEQVSGLTVDRRSDLWSAAVVLWETLTGRRLFTGESPAHVISEIAQGVLSRPGDIVPELAKYNLLFEQLLSRDPNRRPSTAQHFQEQLTRLCAPAAPSAVAAWLEMVVPTKLAAKRQIAREFDVDLRAYRREHFDLAAPPSSRGSAIAAGSTNEAPLITAAGLARAPEPSLGARNPDAPTKVEAWARPTPYAVLAVALFAALAVLLVARRHPLRGDTASVTTQDGGPPSLTTVETPTAYRPPSFPASTPAASTQTRRDGLKRSPASTHPASANTPLNASNESSAGVPPKPSESKQPARNCSPAYVIGPAPDFIKRIKPECL